MADLRISQLPNLIEADLRGPDLIPLADVSASETKNITTAALFKQGVTLLPNSSIPGSRLVGDSVTAAELAPNSVGASELADNSVDTRALQTGAVTDTKVAGDINGGKILVDSLPADRLALNALDRGLDRSSGAIGHTHQIAASTVSGITWDREGHITATRSLAGTDLPIASRRSIGGISVPADSGLTVSSTGEIDHVALMSPGTISGITFDDHGHIKGAVPLRSADLPLAFGYSAGAVVIPTGGTLEIDGNGAVSHATSGVAPGTYPKVEVDALGHVKRGSALSTGDIPDLDTSFITSGTFPEERIADGAITRRKLADYSIAFIQEAQPLLTDVHVGALWYQESTASLHMFNKNSWMPVSIGRLSQENLRFCGLVNATTGALTGVTPFGTTAGYKIGDPPRTADDPQTGVYFVVETAGNAVGVTPGITYDPGDWLLCNGATAGWVRIDTLTSGGGGGGGGATHLDDLLNVDTSKTVADRDIADNQLMIFNPVSNLWESCIDVYGGTY